MANDQVQRNAASQVLPKLKIFWRDGTTNLVMSPLQLISLRMNDRSVTGRLVIPASAAGRVYQVKPKESGRPLSPTYSPPPASAGLAARQQFLDLANGAAGRPGRLLSDIPALASIDVDDDAKLVMSSTERGLQALLTGFGRTG